MASYGMGLFFAFKILHKFSVSKVVNKNPPEVLPNTLPLGYTASSILTLFLH